METKVKASEPQCGQLLLIHSKHMNFNIELYNVLNYFGHRNSSVVILQRPNWMQYCIPVAMHANSADLICLTNQIDFYFPRGVGSLYICSCRHFQLVTSCGHIVIKNKINRIKVLDKIILLFTNSFIFPCCLAIVKP